MKIKAKGIEFELWSVGYEFPYANPISEYRDANWLTIKIRLKSNLVDWTAKDPSLLTWELKAAAQWFKSLAEGKELTCNPLLFIEPTLKFESIGSQQEGKTIKIYLDYELKPDFTKNSEAYSFVFELTPSELSRITKDVEREYLKFPQRK